MIESPFTIFNEFPQIKTAFFVKDDAKQTDQEAAQKLGFTHGAGAHQVHDSRIIVVSGALARTEKADGIITQTKDVLLCVRWADCQNFLLYAPEKDVVGILHVGWRGLLRGAIYNFFTTLKEEYAVEPEECFVAAGPSLCFECANFVDPMRELPNLDLRFIDHKRRKANLSASATDTMERLGVPSVHLERHPRCTCCHPEDFWTYRGGDRKAVKDGMSNMACIGIMG